MHLPILKVFFKKFDFSCEPTLKPLFSVHFLSIYIILFFCYFIYFQFVQFCLNNHDTIEPLLNSKILQSTIEVSLNKYKLKKYKN